MKLMLFSHQGFWLIEKLLRFHRFPLNSQQGRQISTHEMIIRLHANDCEV